jgi:hypothetical protein
MADATIGDDVPWCSLRWSLTLTDAKGRVELRMGEALQVFAAVELDRVHSLDDVRRARGRAASIGFWAALMDGARGLKPDDAAGEMTVRDILARLGVVAVEWSHDRTAADVARGVATALEKLKGAA